MYCYREEREIIKGQLVELQQRVKDYKQMAEDLSRVGDRYFILQVGECTIGANNNNETELRFYEYPVQYTPEAVAKLIQQEYRKQNGRRDFVQVYFAEDWYRKEIGRLNKVINQIKQI